ncbi:MAG: hypothetical protein WAU65_00825 [Candidatus Nanoarchaeia archaeon]
MKEKGMIIVSLIALAVTLVFLVYFVIISVNLDSLVMQSNINLYSKANVFDTQFHDLMQEHTFLLITTLTRSLNSSASFNASYNALQTNVREIAALLSEIYGTYYANNYIALQDEKINDFINYTIDVKDNDSNASSAFLTNIASYEQSISDFWTNSTGVEGIDRNTFESLTAARINDEKETIDYWYQGDYTDYFIKLHDSYTTMGTYADVVVTTIIKQYPKKFQ